MRIAIGLILVVLIGAGIYLGVNYHVEPHYEKGQFAYLKITPRGAAGDPATSGEASSEPPARPLRPTFRIASFNLDGLDEQKLSAFRINDALGRLLPQFELIAVQGVRGRNQGVLARLRDQINAPGRHYDYVTCPTQRRDGIEHYSAFFFDRTALEIDRRTVRFVEDPLRRFRHKPLMASFRARGVEPGAAFTFSLVTVETDPERTAEENDLLADVFHAVRDDGRNEDDVIVLGDFEADENHLGRLGKVLDLTAALSGVPTDTRGNRLLDNIVFNSRATGEFTGKAEVFDMMRQFDLTIENAAEISRHLPVWAEFSVYEGGPQGFVPQVTTPSQHP